MKKHKSKHAGTESRRGAIIKAALTCFSELGFSETSMADIRRHSKASTGSIYHHFKSKEQLAAEVYLEGIRDYQIGLIDALEEQQGAKEGIRAMITHHLKWVKGNADWSRYLFQKRHSVFMSATEEEITGMNRALMQRIIEWFSRQQKSGMLRLLPPDIYVAIILGPCMEFTRQYLSGETGSKISKVIEELTEAAWLALRVEQPLELVQTRSCEV
jgi:AcrR family transcriptional regulator